MSTRKFSKPHGEAMKGAFRSANNELNDVMGEVDRLAGVLEAGGLLGATGDEMADVLGNTLANKISLLAGKMDEMRGDVQRAREQYEEAERRARERFTY